jgi:hypothetical protein
MIVIVVVVLTAAGLVCVVTALAAGGLFLASRRAGSGSEPRVRDPRALLQVGAWAGAGAVTCAVVVVLMLYGVPWR